MRACQTLPEGYREVLQINLQEDKKTAFKVNLCSVVVMLATVALGFLFSSAEVLLDTFSDTESDFSSLLRLVVLLLAYIAYIVLHELTHAAVMRAVGGGRVCFGFTGLYAYAGSREDFFDKISYRYIALAPLVVWGIVFAILSAVVPQGWFWVVWLLQAGNTGGVAGDVYVTAVLWKRPETILVRDTGVDMTVFDKG